MKHPVETRKKRLFGARRAPGARPAAAAAMAVAMALTMAASADVSWAQEEECDLSLPGLCSRTTRAQLRSCRAEVREEYWNGVGVCRNESSGRPECVSGLRDERSEANDECLAQCIARQEVCEDVGPGPYDPDMNPANFMTAAEIAANPNPYFPLVPGTIWTYEAEDEEIVVTVTDQTVDILGIECIVVNDAVNEDGEDVEITDDFYAQDNDGNVWYMGEVSQNFEEGFLDNLDGSWRAGYEGAKGGILFFANPVVGTVFRQEFFLGEAEDMGEILALDGDESTDAADCEGACLVTADYTPVEPDALEHKYYKPGVGMLVEIDPDSGDRVELVDFVQP